jgi:hypothetical protein
MHLPVGAASQISGSGDQLKAQIMAADQSWLISIQTPTSRNTKATAETVAEAARDQLLASAGVPDRTIDREGRIHDKGGQNGERLASTQAQVIEDVKKVVLTGAAPQESRPAARFYVKLPGAGKEAVVRGYTIFMLEPGRFVTFDLATPESNFAKARAAFETCVATVRFADASKQDAERGVAIKTGAEFLNSLSETDYDAAVKSLSDQYFRMYKPAPGGADADAQEIAYRRIRAWKGKRGQIDPSRVEAKWSATDRQDGYLVRIDARFLEEDKANSQQLRVIDSVGFYFMSTDRKEEAWNLTMVIRDPSTRHPATWREVGARSGTSMNVVTDGSGESKASQPTVPPEGYITQVETFLLPELLIPRRKADDKGHAGEFGFYSYQSEFGRVRMRTDKLGQAQNRAGAWVLESKLNEDRDPQTAIYNEHGDLIQATLTDDTVWTPVAAQRLMDLWASKKLPTTTPDVPGRP